MARFLIAITLLHLSCLASAESFRAIVRLVDSDVATIHPLLFGPDIYVDIYEVELFNSSDSDAT
jgi:hypothetical protein